MNKTSAEISQWLVARIAHYSETSPENIDINSDIATFRLDSLLMVNITAEMEEWLGMEVNPTLLWEMRTIAASAEWIVENQEV